MKKYLLILGLFAILTFSIHLLCFGQGGLGLLGGGSGEQITESGDCHSGTYEAGYDGDHSSGADYICYDSGNSSEVATANTADTVSTDWVEFDAQNEHLTFTITGDVSANLESAFSVFFDFWVTNDGDMGTNALIESHEDANNFFY